MCMMCAEGMFFVYILSYVHWCLSATNDCIISLYFATAHDRCVLQGHLPFNDLQCNINLTTRGGLTLGFDPQQWVTLFFLSHFF